MKKVYHFQISGENDPGYPRDMIVIEMPHEEFVKMLKRCIDTFEGSNHNNYIQLSGYISELNFTELKSEQI